MEGEYDEGKLIFWSNGGPGASSMFGFMTEVGPFSLNADSLTTDEYLSTGIPTVFPNENSWSQLRDLLIFEAPSPVGFSYCGDDVSADGTSCGDWTDELAAENNLLALQAFYLKFPELKTKDLYLSGESYAGVYIPTMARSIITNDPSINLKGFAVGDACTGQPDLRNPPWGTSAQNFAQMKALLVVSVMIAGGAMAQHERQKK